MSVVQRAPLWPPVTGGHAASAQLGDFAADLDAVLAQVRAVLIEKNKRYGDSALNPVRVFSRASAQEQIRVRLDDKLSRLARGTHDTADTEDAELDALGYLVLLRIARMRESQEYLTGLVSSDLTAEVGSKVGSPAERSDPSSDCGELNAG